MWVAHWLRSQGRAPIGVRGGWNVPGGYVTGC